MAKSNLLLACFLVGIVGFLCLIVPVFSTHWLRWKISKSSDTKVDVGLFFVCAGGTCTVHVPQTALHVCAAASWLGAGVSIILVSDYICCGGRKRLVVAAMFCALASSVASVALIGTFAASVSTKSKDLAVDYGWSFYLYIIGSLLVMGHAILVVAFVVMVRKTLAEDNLDLTDNAVPPAGANR